MCILLEKADFLAGWGDQKMLSENVILEKAYRRRKQRIKNTNQLAFVLVLLDEEDAVVSRENIFM